jgi:hypothetical protein
VLKTVHKQFFNDFEAVGRDTKKLPNVKEILEKKRREIFSGFSFVFSGLLHQNSNFEEQEIWRLSKDFGGDCEYELSDKTTHLISNRIDTEKALESHKRGIPAVKPDWIYESCRKWERLDWKLFKLTINGTKRRNKRSATEFECQEQGEEGQEGEEGEEEKGEEGEGEGEEEEEEEGEAEDFNEILKFEPILNEAELEEIQKELLDLEEGSESTSGDSESTGNESTSGDSESTSGVIGESEGMNDSKYSSVELSDGEFSDLLNYSSNSEDNNN